MTEEFSSGCTNCGDHNRVLSSRHTKLGVVRRRECLLCGNRWTTKEISADRLDQLLEIESKYTLLRFALEAPL